MNQKLKQTLTSYVEAGRPIIYINHFDFMEVKETICSIDPDALNIEYDNALGCGNLFTDNQFASNYGKKDLAQCLEEDVLLNNKLDAELHLILKDINSLIDGPKKDDRVIALLKGIAERTLYADGYPVIVFILSDTLTIPHELENYITIIDYPLPEINEIKQIIKSFAKETGTTVDEGTIDSISLSFKGLNEFQINQILNLAYQNGGNLRKEDEQLILDEKEQIVKKSGMLEIIKVKGSKDDIGGLDNMKKWLEKKSYVFQNLDQALKFGVDIPKGILIVGKPGCGKSLTAKATAAILNIPLVRLDIGRLMGKYIGESEENLRKALKLSEAIAPCVLWIDEIEKAFMGMASNSDSGVTARLFGHFLTWMQEKENTVFIVATANNINALPPEFLRKGRFDELFYVDYPAKEERADILRIHLKKRKQLNSEIDINSLADSTEGYSGSDIEAVIKDAVETKFVENQSLKGNESKTKLRTHDIRQSIKSITPFNLEKDDKKATDKIKEFIKKYGIKYASSQHK